MTISAFMVALPRPGEPAVPVLRLSVDQYHAMMEKGIVREGEPFEPIDGRIVCKNRAAARDDPTTIGDRHVWSVVKLGEVSRLLEPFGCHLRAQQPISIPPYDEPEPDGAIVVGTEDDYLHHKPAAGEILCVIEVSDSSLLYDRRVKGRTYATAGLPLYVFLNLVDVVAEVYRLPGAMGGSYGPPDVLPKGQVLALPTATDTGVEVPVERLLPP
ncbi:MAG: hypothetical protein JWO31_1389 [Phycisphaerales bacterium]|nr:hypothetical protein [Phycisphaerales bacterium]